MTSQKKSQKGSRTARVIAPGLNEAKARILILISQVAKPNKYARFIAFKLGYSYDYVNKQIQELEFLGYVFKVKRGQKAFIEVRRFQFLDAAKQYIQEHRSKQKLLKGYREAKGEGKV